MTSEIAAPGGAFRDALVEHLKRELEIGRALLDALLGEQQAVSGFDEARIEAGAARKEALVDALQEATGARLALMRKAGFDGNWPGIENCIEAADDEGGTLQALFDELSGLGRRCIQENRLVGRLINRRVQFIGKALGSLAPRAAGELTYQASGMTEGAGEHRRFGCV